jgi:hypothetical protein
MIFDNREEPVAYEPLSVYSEDDEIIQDNEITQEFATIIEQDDEITQQFETIIKQLKQLQPLQQCEYCKSCVEHTYLYEHSIKLCNQCWYLYDDKFKCRHCQNIIFTTFWYLSINREQICLNCHKIEKDDKKDKNYDDRKKQHDKRCSGCGIIKNNYSLYNGKNGKICHKCYKSECIQDLCTQCNSIKYLKKWYNGSKGVVCKSCYYGY